MSGNRRVKRGLGYFSTLWTEYTSEWAALRQRSAPNHMSSAQWRQLYHWDARVEYTSQRLNAGHRTRGVTTSAHATSTRTFWSHPRGRAIRDSLYRAHLRPNSLRSAPLEKSPCWSRRYWWSNSSVARSLPERQKFRLLLLPYWRLVERLDLLPSLRTTHGRNNTTWRKLKKKTW